jgi:hypothetical protein
VSSSYTSVGAWEHDRHHPDPDQTVKKHKCVKNNEGSSKTMEAAGLVKMLSQILGEKGVSVCTIVSDKDSNARAKAHHIQNGG